eukprot:817484-Prorocentrum_minimum.AAC.3
MTVMEPCTLPLRSRRAHAQGLDREQEGCHTRNITTCKYDIEIKLFLQKTLNWTRVRSSPIRQTTVKTYGQNIALSLVEGKCHRPNNQCDMYMHTHNRGKINVTVWVAE